MPLWLERTGRDIAYAWRSIRRMPAVAAVVVASLGVGIGVNTVVFSWIEAIVLRPIPGVKDATRFYTIEPRTTSGSYPGTSWLEYRDLRERVGSLSSLMAFRMVPLYLGESGRVERGTGLLVSDNYFDGLGLRPAFGRFFVAEDVARAGGPPVTVVSYTLWQTRFASDPNVIGRTIRVNGSDLTVVGVAPRGFQGTVMRLSFDLWLPATLAPVIFSGSRELDDRAFRNYSLIGALDPGATEARAQADVDQAMRVLAETYPLTNTSVRADVFPFWRAPRGPQQLLGKSLALLQGILLLLLLAVCGNTANLLLARASARQREIAVRLALGAGRWRIAKLLLTENLLLAALGSLAGVAIARWGTDALTALPPLRVRGIPVSFETSVDGVSLAFAIALGLASGLVFGIAPALQLARADPHRMLRAGANPAPQSRLRHTLMGAEVALALVVLIASGLFLRSFMETRDADTGFHRDGLLLAGYDLTGRKTDDASARRFVTTLLDRLREQPSIGAAAVSTNVPLDIHGLPMRTFTLQGRARADGVLDDALSNTVTPGYFAVMGIPILAGRDFADLTNATAPREAIVNRAFVETFARGAEPIGLTLESRGRAYTIVGVVQTSLSDAFGEPPTPVVYYSYRDRPGAVGEVHLRSRSGPESAVAPALRTVVREIDPDLPIYDVRSMNDHIEANLIFRRVPARLFSVLGPLLLLLAASGIYAVVAYGVSLRTTEIGVRLALGATPSRLVREFVGGSLAIVSVGAMAGWLLAAAVVLDVLAMGALDVPVFAGVPVILLSVAAIASWVPTRRAARIDPMIALRQE